MEAVAKKNLLVPASVRTPVVQIIRKIRKFVVKKQQREKYKAGRKWQNEVKSP
jgi:hypothetical protein